MPCGKLCSSAIQSDSVLSTIFFWLRLVIKELIISIASSENFSSFSFCLRYVRSIESNALERSSKEHATVLLLSIVFLNASVQ